MFTPSKGVAEVGDMQREAKRKLLLWEPPRQTHSFPPAKWVDLDKQARAGEGLQKRQISTNKKGADSPVPG